MKQIRLILGIAVIVIVVGIVAVLIFRDRGTESTETEETPATNAGPASIEAENIKYTESKEGKVIWEIEAGSAEFYKEEERTEFDKIKVTFFYQDEYQLKLSGDKGILNNDTKNIVIKDNVFLEFAEKYRLETNSLNYTTETDEIITEDPVAVTGPDVNFTGKGLTFNLSNEELFVNSDVVADFTKAEDETDKDKKKKEKKENIRGFEDASSLESPLHIRSGGFYGNRKGSYIRFNKGAHVTYEESTLNAGTITVYFNSKEGGVSKIEAAGNVKLKQKDMNATCGRLLFDYEKNKLFLTKNPVIWRGEDMVKGDEITYDLTTSKSVVTAGKENRAHLTIYPKQEEEEEF
ncbi:MAG: LPS export ABC transporter periplasmic protein LptC [Deltaproteobacteria bacterium]|uniref:LPS export ABC transporter periplasmic protein LptC n=1 Tax=Candidatus Zymogenus saltonus TaxID=2844893 RepID=A0A9D8PRV5_9DELT|nr:LPS export ABC transporter periplasmic protein LptC [Candidatus Zymogenus saltonus]